MLEATLVGLQALEAEYGSDSSKTAAAREAVKSMLQWSVMQLESKYGGDITYQVRHWGGWRAFWARGCCCTRVTRNVMWF